MNNVQSESPRKKYTKLPKSVSLKSFNQYVSPCLSKGKRGPKPKISRHHIFNYILHVLHTGMPWNALVTTRNEIHPSNVYKWHLRWSKDGSYERLFQSSISHLKETEQLDLSVLHGDGSNAIAKKGAKTLAIQGTNIKKV